MPKVGRAAADSVLFRDYRDLPDMQPSRGFDKQLRPATACGEKPASRLTTRLADTSVNKNNQVSHRCPVFAIAWTPWRPALFILT